MATPPSPASAAPDSRLQRLKRQPRGPGEAAFFYYDPHFACDAVKVLPGEYFVHDEDILIMTTLGSCIAACLWDRHARIGGMNHFLLPEGDGETGRYGSFAMELLVNEMLKRGASRGGLEAKVFGGAQIMSGQNTMQIGERNTAFVLEYLKAERIPVVSRDVLGVHPRKVCFLPVSGRAMVKRLGSMNAEVLAARERSAATLGNPRAASAGSVDLF